VLERGGPPHPEVGSAPKREKSKLGGAVIKARETRCGGGSEKETGGDRGHPGGEKKNSVAGGGSKKNRGLYSLGGKRIACKKRKIALSQENKN